ncbi:MAG: M14 family metallopeptidase [Ilumatobacteraceae bacterium]
MSSTISLSGDYPTAQHAFLAAAQTVLASVTSFPHPLTGPNGEPLAIDVAELGSPDAEKTVVVVSGTHGVEGYCGSALQTEWLTKHSEDRPGDTRVILVHGFNPFGFAWVRRVNEDNVDLNRNFINWGTTPPMNTDYQRVANLLVPTKFTEAEQQRTLNELFTVAGEWGMDRFQAAVSGGQFTYPTGLFYGGTGPVWSHRWIGNWAATALRQTRQLTIIDLHTGLGPWGVGELISSRPHNHAEFQRAIHKWGEIRSMVDGDSVSANVTGDWLGITSEFSPTMEVTAVALEFGTVDLITVMQALRADAWLHAHGDPASPYAHQVRTQVRAAFADDDPKWIATCWQRFHQVMSGALA